MANEVWVSAVVSSCKFGCRCHGWIPRYNPDRECWQGLAVDPWPCFTSKVQAKGEFRQPCSVERPEAFERQPTNIGIEVVDATWTVVRNIPSRSAAETTLPPLVSSKTCRPTPIGILYAKAPAGGFVSNRSIAARGHSDRPCLLASREKRQTQSL